MVGKNTYRVRRELDVTQDVMARRLGMSAYLLGGIERGRRNITPESPSNLAAARGVDTHALLCSAESGVARDAGLPLDMLARYAAAVNTPVQALLLDHGPVLVGRTMVAFMISAPSKTAVTTRKRRIFAGSEKVHPRSGVNVA